MNDQDLIDLARAACRERQLSPECTVGEVGAALLAGSGRVYVGISISAACGVGFCAEHGAIAQMVSQGETRVRKAAALNCNGRLLPPCGRCRELLYQIDRGNLATEILLEEGEVVTLADLLPERWQQVWG